VVWYTGQFYALFFLEKMLKVDGATTNVLMAIALGLGTPFFVIFGWLSDRIGRKPIIMAGCALACVSYFPLFHALTDAANPALAAAQARAPVQVVSHDAECSFQFDPVGRNKFDARSCDIAKSYLARGGISYANVEAPAGTVAEVRIGGRRYPAPDPARVTGPERAVAIAAYADTLGSALAAAGYPTRAENMNTPLVVLILWFDCGIAG
jgi:hypothetical protein